jgi:hypothetical protein
MVPVDPYSEDLGQELRRGAGLLAVLAGLLLAASTLPPPRAAGACLPCERILESSVSTS